VTRVVIESCDVLLQDSLLTTVKTVFPGEVTAKLSPTDDEKVSFAKVMRDVLVICLILIRQECQTLSVCWRRIAVCLCRLDTGYIHFPKETEGT
jgi:hypothetical protein